LQQISFYSYQHAHPTYIHSFPTRRSSDLRTPPPSESAAFARLEAAIPQSGHSRKRSLLARVRPIGQEPHDGKPHPYTSWHAAARSEEHTSELQSRSDLVCRLLLEKKKKKI